MQGDAHNARRCGVEIEPRPVDQRARCDIAGDGGEVDDTFVVQRGPGERDVVTFEHGGAGFDGADSDRWRTIADKADLGGARCRIACGVGGHRLERAQRLIKPGQQRAGHGEGDDGVQPIAAAHARANVNAFDGEGDVGDSAAIEGSDLDDQRPTTEVPGLRERATNGDEGTLGVVDDLQWEIDALAVREVVGLGADGHRSSRRASSNLDPVWWRRSLDDEHTVDKEVD